MSTEGLIKLCAWAAAFLGGGVALVDLMLRRYPRVRIAGFLVVVALVGAGFIWGLTKLAAAR